MSSLLNPLGALLTSINYRLQTLSLSENSIDNLFHVLLNQS